MERTCKLYVLHDLNHHAPYETNTRIKIAKAHSTSNCVPLSKLHLVHQHRLTQSYSQDHAEHDEDVPQCDEDPEVPQAEQKLSDVVP